MPSSVPHPTLPWCSMDVGASIHCTGHQPAPVCSARPGRMQTPCSGTALLKGREKGGMAWWKPPTNVWEQTCPWCCIGPSHVSTESLLESWCCKKADIMHLMECAICCLTNIICYYSRFRSHYDLFKSHPGWEKCHLEQSIHVTLLYGLHFGLHFNSY